MKSRHGFPLPFALIPILLACLSLAACSAAGESARYKSQADQFLAEGHLAEAVLTYRQALISHPDDPELLSGLGKALSAQGRSRSAAEVLKRAASLKPNDSSIQTSLAKLATRPQEGLSLKLAWFSSGIESEAVGAVLAEGKIFVAYADGHLLALDQGSGQSVWQIETAGGTELSPGRGQRTGLGGRRKRGNPCVCSRNGAEPGKLPNQRGSGGRPGFERRAGLLPIQRWNAVRSGTQRSEISLESGDRGSTARQPAGERTVRVCWLE